METQASPLVLTKLRIPAARSRVISRMRIIDLTPVGQGCPLMLVCAPAGYGKTTFLIEWAKTLEEKGSAVSWYALDSGDDDPVLFCSYLVASLIQALGPLTELVQLAQFLRSSAGPDLQRILPTIINAVLTGAQECAVILDDYHLITSPAIHSALAYILEHLPANLHIAIGSRSDPPLPLARLRAQGKLLEVRTALLRFTSDESAHFLSDVMLLDLPSAAAAALAERTEGWAAGLQLAALSLAGRSDQEAFIAAFSGSHRFLVEYLLEEVFQRQPLEVQSFLLTTSILEHMCAPLCDAVLGSASASGKILEQLEKANLFVVALDDRRYWYRYHHLFRDFLQTRLKKTDAENIPWLHQAACEWLTENASLREAAHHAFQTQNQDYAAAFVEQHSFTMIIHSEISTVYEWCSALPEETLQAHPVLAILQCYAPAFSFQRQKRGWVEARLGQVEKRVAGMKDQQQARELGEHAAIVRSFLAMAPDPAVAPQDLLALAGDMLTCYPEGDPGQFSWLLMSGYAHLALHDAPLAGRLLEAARAAALRGQLYFGVVESAFHLARLAHSQGSLHRAAEICRQGQADIAALLSQPEQNLPALGSLDIALGCVLIEQDRLDEAEERLLHGLNLIGWGANPYYLMTAYTALFRLYEIRGKPAQALACLDRLDTLWPDIAFCTQGLRAAHDLQNGSDNPDRRSAAQEWCQRYASSFTGDIAAAGMGPVGAAEAYYLANLAWIRCQIATGHPGSAQALLERQQTLAATHGLDQRAIELSLLAAQASLAEGEQEQDRVIRRPDGEIVEPLSERELEVLRLIADGASNQNIAEQLVITVGTVKSHINHILGKLNARNRTEAVALARKAGYPDL